MEYSVTKIDNMQAFLDIKNAWDELLKHETPCRPYLDHSWFKMWLEHFQDKKKLNILVIRQNKHIKAICPLLLVCEKFKGIPVNKLELIGNVYSSIRNLIFDVSSDAEKTQIIQKIIRTLRDSTNWDIADLRSLPEESFDFPAFRQALQTNRLTWEEYFCFGNWYLDSIDFTGDQYIQSRTSNIKNNIKRYSKKLQKMGNFKSVMVTKGTNEEIDKFMDAYYTVYGKSWKEPEMDPTFHRHLAKLARDKGWLRLGFIFLDNTPIATQLWLVCGGVAYIAKLAYDEAYKKLIPGVILSADMMKYVIDVDHVKEVDYLEGDEPYKKDWTPKRRERKGLLIFNKTPKGQYLASMEMRILPFFRKYEVLSALKKTISKYIS